MRKLAEVELDFGFAPSRKKGAAGPGEELDVCRKIKNLAVIVPIAGLTIDFGAALPSRARVQSRTSSAMTGG
jgi:hypothetical protein